MSNPLFRLRFYSLILLLGTFCTIAAPSISGQSFGKNKINYDTFTFLTHETPHFIIYYYPEVADRVLRIEELIENAYLRISADLDHQLTDRIPVILYLSRAHFQQTNVILDFIPESVAGFNEVYKRRLVIPTEGSARELENLIVHELMHSFQFDILFGSRISNIAAVPLWIMEGTAEYEAGDWDAQGRMVLRDAVAHDLVSGIEDLESFDRFYSAYVGYKLSQSIIEFIITTYGKQALRDLIWELRRALRTQDRIDRGIRRVFGISQRELSDQWLTHLRRLVAVAEQDKEFTSDYGRPLVTGSGDYYQSSPCYSPSGELVAVVTHRRNRQVIVAGHFPSGEADGVDEEFGQRPFIIGEGRGDWDPLYIITDGRALDWSRDGRLLAFFGRDENYNALYIVNAPQRTLQEKQRTPVEMAASPSFDPTGRFIACHGFREGRSDIFIIDIHSGETQRFTDDDRTDRSPAWSPDGKWIAYTTEIDGVFRLAVKPADGTASERLLTSPDGFAFTPAWTPDSSNIVYVSDAYDGILNLFLLNVESGSQRMLTNVFGGNFTPVVSPDGTQIAFSSFNRGRLSVFQVPMGRAPQVPAPKPIAPIGISADGAALPKPGDSGQSSVAFNRYQTKKMAVDAQKPKLRLIPDVAGGQFGINSNGDYSVDGGIILSDMLGNHRMFIVAERLRGLTNYYFQYQYLRRRIDFAGSVGYGESYVYGSGWRYERKQVGGTFVSSYPFDLTHRVELSLSYERREDEFRQQIYSRYQEDLALAGVSFVGDTTLFSGLGPHSGRRYRLSYSHPIPITSDAVDLDLVYLDTRQYFPIGSTATLAFRLLAAQSNGADREYFFLGGSSTIRGYDYGSFGGTRAALFNAELRFPFIHGITFAGGLRFSGISGVLFWDFGIAGMDWSEMKIWNGSQSRMYLDSDLAELPPGQRVLAAVPHSSVGFGVRIILLGVPWHFEFAQRTDLSSLDTDTIYQFSIRQIF